MFALASAVDMVARNPTDVKSEFIVQVIKDHEPL